MKRGGKGQKPAPKGEPVVPTTIIGQQFYEYSKILDARSEQRERLIKSSREITLLSKRVIFLLQRGFDSDDKEGIISKAKEDLKPIHTLIHTISSELKGDKDEYYRYYKSFSPGLQEYIEAEYLESGTLLTREKAQTDINRTIPTDVPLFYLTLEDYLLGITDLTGELMRAATACVSARKYQYCYQIAEFLRNLFDCFNMLPHSGEMAKKMAVMQSSLQKVEALCFTVKVRGSEYPELLLDTDSMNVVEE